jgi:hypothetical protein
VAGLVFARLYLLCVNLTGIGLGGTATAWVTDHVLHDEARVGEAMSWVAGIAAPLAALILWRGLGYYREAVAGESQPLRYFFMDAESVTSQ